MKDRAGHPDKKWAVQCSRTPWHIWSEVIKYDITLTSSSPPLPQTHDTYTPDLVRVGWPHNRICSDLNTYFTVLVLKTIAAVADALLVWNEQIVQSAMDTCFLFKQQTNTSTFQATSHFYHITTTIFTLLIGNWSLIVNRKEKKYMVLKMFYKENIFSL